MLPSEGQAPDPRVPGDRGCAGLKVGIVPPPGLAWVGVADDPPHARGDLLDDGEQGVLADNELGFGVLVVWRHGESGCGPTHGFVLGDGQGDRRLAGHIAAFAHECERVVVAAVVGRRPLRFAACL